MNLLLIITYLFAAYGLMIALTRLDSAIRYRKTRGLLKRVGTSVAKNIRIYPLSAFKDVPEIGEFKCNQPWTEEDLLRGLFNGLGQKIEPHRDESRKCNPGPCPMPELSPGHFICQKCGYEVDYRPIIDGSMAEDQQAQYRSARVIDPPLTFADLQPHMHTPEARAARQKAHDATVTQAQADPTDDDTTARLMEEQDDEEYRRLFTEDDFS